MSRPDVRTSGGSEVRRFGVFLGQVDISVKTGELMVILGKTGMAKEPCQV